MIQENWRAGENPVVVNCIDSVVEHHNANVVAIPNEDKVSVSYHLRIQYVAARKLH